MKMDEYLQEKEKLREAEEKVKEYKEVLKEEKKKKINEGLHKFNFLNNLKPWTKNDLLLVILIIFLFVVAYNHGSSSNENDNEGFFSSIFGFLVKDNQSDNADLAVISDVDDVINESVEEEPEIVETNTTDEASVPEDDEEEEDIFINFNIWTEYEDSKFDYMETSSDIINYFVVIQNSEDFDLKCESPDSSIGVEIGEERQIFAKAYASDAGEDNQLIINHEFTCYDSQKSIDGGYTKKTIVTIKFN